MLNDKYFWNEASHSHDIKEKADCIKESGNWEAVRQEYLRLKNTYLTRNDYNHPSFVCYIEAVNNLFNKLRQKHIVLICLSTKALQNLSAKAIFRSDGNNRQKSLNSNKKGSKPRFVRVLSL